MPGKRFTGLSLLLLASVALAASVLFHGVQHTPVGDATLAVESPMGTEILRVGNIDADGFADDGVRLEPLLTGIEAEAIEIELSMVDVAAWIMTHEIGHDLGFATATSGSDLAHAPPVGWSADFTGEGSSHYRAEFYLNSSLIHVENDIPADSIACFADTLPDRFEIKVQPPALGSRFTGKYLTAGGVQHEFRDGSPGYVTEFRFIPLDLGGARGGSLRPFSPSGISTSPVIQTYVITADGTPEFTIEDETYTASVSGAGDPFSPRLTVFASPNPFRGGTRITLSLTAESTVRTCIFDAQGRLVTQLPPLRLGAGEQTVSWDGRDASGRAVRRGVYFARLLVDGKGRHPRDAVRLLKL